MSDVAFVKSLGEAGGGIKSLSSIEGNALDSGSGMQ